MFISPMSPPRAAFRIEDEPDTSVLPSSVVLPRTGFYFPEGHPDRPQGEELPSLFTGVRGIGILGSSYPRCCIDALPRPRITRPRHPAQPRPARACNTRG